MSTQKKTPPINLGKKLLHEWMENHNFSIYRLAKDLDISYKTAWEWIKKTRNPIHAYAKKIERYTDGFIPRDSWLQLLEKPSNSVTNSTKKRNAPKHSHPRTKGNGKV